MRPGTSHIASNARTAEDEALIAAIGDGDAAAFAELVTRHLDSIHAYLHRMTGSETEAEDLSQETFLRVWRRARSYRPGRVQPATWLHTIAHNLCVDAFRRASRHRATSEPTVLGHLEDELADPARQQQARQALEQIGRKLAELPLNQRSATILCLVQGHSTAEAAEILGVGKRAVESLLARARRTLRATLPEPEAAPAGARRAPRVRAGGDTHD